MLDRFYYENSFGERVYFGQGGIIADYNDLRDYEWESDIINNKITRFRRGSAEKSLPTVFIGGSEIFCRKQRNKAFVVFEKDVLANKKGRIYIGNYYLNCYISGISNDKYKEDGRYLESTLKLITDDTAWHRDKTFSFIGNYDPDGETGYDFPYEYPYEYSANTRRANVLKNNSEFPADFTLVIYGPCENPYVIIGEHRYQVNDSLLAGEFITISNQDKTIIKTNLLRQEENIINKRYKEESIFERVPGGLSPITWNGSFGFDLIVHEKRSEPVWEYKEEDVNVEILSGHEITDNNGEFILDNLGQKIEVVG